MQRYSFATLAGQFHVSRNQFANRVNPMREIKGFKMRQLLNVIVVSVLAAGQMFLVAHACANVGSELASQAAAATPSIKGVAFETARRAMDGDQFLPKRSGSDCTDLALRPVFASETGILPYRSRIVPRVSTDSPKPVVAGPVRSSWNGIAARGVVASGWLGSPRLIERPPHTILHCCWRI